MPRLSVFLKGRIVASTEESDLLSTDAIAEAFCHDCRYVYSRRVMGHIQTAIKRHMVFACLCGAPPALDPTTPKQPHISRLMPHTSRGRWVPSTFVASTQVSLCILYGPYMVTSVVWLPLWCGSHFSDFGRRPYDVGISRLRHHSL